MSRSTCGNTSARYGWSRQLSKRFVRRLTSPSRWLSLTWINATCESFLVTHSAHTRRYRSGRPSVTQKTCLASASRSFLGTHSLPITKKNNNDDINSRFVAFVHLLLNLTGPLCAISPLSRPDRVRSSRIVRPRWESQRMQRTSVQRAIHKCWCRLHAYEPSASVSVSVRTSSRVLTGA